MSSMKVCECLSSPTSTDSDVCPLSQPPFVFSAAIPHARQKEHNGQDVSRSKDCQNAEMGPAIIKQKGSLSVPM